mmetsp:Transcript_14227/g.22228  ORF Transcript_14227/g.22228 Transcript_14227/m.22228 type:complete len:256 (+) Transcript_14227:64-831(+)
MQNQRSPCATLHSFYHWTQEKNNSMIDQDNIDSNDNNTVVPPADDSPYLFGKIWIDEDYADATIVNEDLNNNTNNHRNDLDDDYHNIPQQKEKEEDHPPPQQQQQQQQFVSPNDFDIICGRSKLSHNHTGNKRFRIIVDMNRERYQHAPSRGDKTRITQEIMDMIRCSGGRFLKWMDDRWMDASEDYVREKVSHALRSAKDTVFQRCGCNTHPHGKQQQQQKEENSIYESAKARELFASQQQIMMQLIADAQQDE